MKILQIITRLDKGGSAELTLQFCAELAKRGHEVTLISGKTTEAAWDVYAYARRHHFKIEFVNSLVRNINPLLDLTAFFELYTDIQRLRPDIVHTNSSKAGIIGRLAAHATGTRKIFHSPHGHIFYGYYSPLISKIFILIEKLTAHFSTKIFNLTKTGKQDHIAVKIAEPEKFSVSSCGIDLTPIRQKPGALLHQKNALSPGSDGLYLLKNLSLLLRAAHKLKGDNRFEFRIIGDGEDMEKYQAYAAEKGLKNVRFLGYRHNLPMELSECHIFVLTSLNEGFGRVIVEAMAAGLPIIATRVGGVPALIKEDINGWLIPSNDVTQLVSRLDYCGKNPDICKTIGKNNRKRSFYYTIETYTDRIENEYNI